MLAPFGALGLMSAVYGAQTITFWSAPGNSSHVDGSLDGTSVPDHLNGSSYTGYVGEMLLIPEDSGYLGGVSSGARGMATADSDGLFGAARGYVGFCIDSDTAFLSSSNLSNTFEYQPLSFEQANARYLVDGVSSYLNGGLKRASYLLERFYDEAHAGGDLTAAALQVAIWEVLYDGSADVSEGAGNYYVRSNSGISILDDRADSVTATASGWFAQAAADDWGGAGYNPDENVIFWVDPDFAGHNQSIISLRVQDSGLTIVPEPGSAVLAGLAAAVGLLRRRRTAF